MSKPNAQPVTALAADAPAPAAPAAPSASVDTALAAEGDGGDVSINDIRAALGMPPVAGDDAPKATADSDADLSDEERAAAQAELADPDADAPAAAEPDAPAAEATPAPEIASLKASLEEATAARTRAEADLAAARERLSAHEAEASTRTDAGLLDTITDLDSLAAQRTRFVNLYAWAVKHPDGGALPSSNGEVELSREEVASLQADAYTIVQDGIPKREAFLRAAAAREAEALNAYPWIKETGKGIGAEAAKLLASAPALRRLPEAKLLAADSVIGARLRAAGVTLDEATLAKMIAAAKPAAAGKPAALAQPPRVPPAAPSRPGVIPPRTRGNSSEQQAAARLMQRTRGSIDSIEASIAAKLGGR